MVVHWLLTYYKPSKQILENIKGKPLLKKNHDLEKYIRRLSSGYDYEDESKLIHGTKINSFYRIKVYFIPYKKVCLYIIIFIFKSINLIPIENVLLYTK